MINCEGVTKCFISYSDIKSLHFNSIDYCKQKHQPEWFSGALISTMVIDLLQAIFKYFQSRTEKKKTPDLTDLNVCLYDWKYYKFLYIDHGYNEFFCSVHFSCGRLWETHWIHY